MSKPNTPVVHHSVSLENDFAEVPYDGAWVRREPNGYARASCSCGELDTGFVGGAEAASAAREHAALYLPGVPFGAGLVRPGEETTT